MNNAQDDKTVNDQPPTLPSRHQLGDRVLLRHLDDSPDRIAFVTGIRFSPGAVRYDVSVELPNRRKADPQQPRPGYAVEGVESSFVIAG